MQTIFNRASAAIENILLEAVRQVIGAPETIQPFGLVACGYPDQPVLPANRYDPTRVHHERW